jgi:hypothetical protein
MSKYVRRNISTAPHDTIEKYAAVYVPTEGMMVVQLDDSSTFRSSTESRVVAGESWYEGGLDRSNSQIDTRWSVSGTNRDVEKHRRN